MPVKRRTDKSRRLDEYRIEQLRYGPDSVLIAAIGYLGEPGFAVSSFDHHSTPEQRAGILEAMRKDWQRHRDRLLAEGGDWWAEEQFETLAI